MCVAVGANAAIIRTINGGKTWTSVQSSYGSTNPSTPFVSVRCPVASVCSIIAGPNVVLHTTNGGQTWQAQTIALPVPLSRLGHLACPTRGVCFATAPSPSADLWYGHPAALFTISHAKKTWRRLAIPSSLPCPGDCQANHPTVGLPLQWISCQTAQNCVAGGITFVGAGHNGYAAAVIRTSNGGATWRLVNQGFIPNIATCPTTSICTGIFYEPRSPTHGPFLQRSIDGGKTWSPWGPTPTLRVLTAIACSGKTFCGLAGPHGRVATARGLTLAPETSPTTRNLSAVACPKPGTCYAVGAVGTILARNAQP